MLELWETKALTWGIAAAAIGGVLWRPKDWPEAIWACLGGGLMVACGLLPVGEATHAVAKGTDVYFFLTGMMLLSELARRAGVFDWLASHAVAAADGSREKLFALVYGVGIVVTVFLSNDATAVVLTPAVYAAVQKARTKPTPYLFICAFIANAASFVLPISNPANLVVYGRALPPLFLWLRTFLLPSVFSIGITYLALRWFFRKQLIGAIAAKEAPASLSLEGRLASGGILVTAVVLLCASAFAWDLGLPTLVSAVVVLLAATRAKVGPIRRVLAGVSWSVLPLVAGLFILVEAVARTGAGESLAALLQWCGSVRRMGGSLLASFGVALLSNLVNNLPVGVLAGGALQTVSVPAYIRDSILVGVDLGPNLSVTGSLATVLWLIALRREGERISGWEFLKAGLVMMPAALIVVTITVAILSR